ncbi:hypothetical protein MMC10_001536 [Thelotrema lepadinum]|nr:hypothetical protein [Thelotrema lepadinum]
MAPKKGKKAAQPKKSKDAAQTTKAATRSATNAKVQKSTAKAAGGAGKKSTAAATKTKAPAKSKATPVEEPAATVTRKKASATSKAKPKATSTQKATKSTAASATSKRAKTPTASSSASAPRPRAKSTASKATTKATTTKKTSSAAGKKRAREEDVESLEEEPPAKKRPSAPKKPGPNINDAPTQKLNVFVFGEGSAGELGLGHMNESQKRQVLDVKRPRLNANLLPADLGVVQLSTGGMHIVALTHDNKILTWGLNDQGALGRSTRSGEQLRDVDAKEEDDDLNSGLNPLEAAPSEVDYINVPDGTIFTKVAAGDSITMALTSTGLVYGCGTFRSNDGVLGFSKEVETQETLAPIARLRNIKDLVCGSNHVLALDSKGNVFAFGAGQQNQLGRRVIERNSLNALTPSELALPRNKVTSIASGAYHSFAMDKTGDVWAWGANSFGQTGIAEDVGNDNAAVIKPQLVDALKGKEISQLAGGIHHSLAATKDGNVLAWGRCDGAQIGMELDDVPEENFFHNEDGTANKRLVLVPTALPEPTEVKNIAVNSDHNIAITNAGKAYSWGFSANYQTGQGTNEDVVEATLIDNTAVRDETLVWAGAGGQYSMLASNAMEGVETTATVNGELANGTDAEPEKSAEVNGDETAEADAKSENENVDSHTETVEPNSSS